MSKVILSCTKLKKVYQDSHAGIEVLTQIDLSVVAGEVIAIVGSSGSGKSTLLHLLGGLDQPNEGEVRLNGMSYQTMTERQRCFLRNRYLGFIYQFHHLLPEFSALENVGMPLLLQGESPHVIQERAGALLEQVGLKNRIQHRLSQLSGGERQRVAIARALVAKPLCVLADEPTGNLDPENADRVIQLFFELQKQQQSSIVIVTHDLEIARRANRVLKIENKRLVTA